MSRRNAAEDPYPDREPGHRLSAAQQRARLGEQGVDGMASPSPERLNATAPPQKIQPIGLSGCREATSAPTSAKPRVTSRQMTSADPAWRSAGTSLTRARDQEPERPDQHGGHDGESADGPREGGRRPSKARVPEAWSFPRSFSPLTFPRGRPVCVTKPSSQRLSWRHGAGVNAARRAAGRTGWRAGGLRHAQGDGAAGSSGAFRSPPVARRALPPAVARPRPGSRAGCATPHALDPARRGRRGMDRHRRRHHRAAGPARIGARRRALPRPRGGRRFPRAACARPWRCSRASSWKVSPSATARISTTGRLPRRTL